MHQLTTKHKQSRTAFYWSSTLRSNFSTQYCRILEWNSPRVLAKGDFLEVASVSCFFASSVIDDNVWVGTLVNLNFWNHIYNSTSLNTFDCTLIVKYTLVSCYHGVSKKLLLFQLKKALRLRSQSWRPFNDLHELCLQRFKMRETTKELLGEKLCSFL